VFPPWLSLDVPTVSLGDPTAAGWELCSSRRAALRVPGNPASPDAGRAAAGTHSAHTDTTEIIRAGSTGFSAGPLAYREWERDDGSGSM